MADAPANDLRLRIDPLRQDQIDQAYASLELTGVPMSLAAWRRYAMDRIAAGGGRAGVLSLQCNRDYLHGFLGYEIVAVGSERHMTVDLFRTVDYVSDNTAGSLMAGAEAIAAKQGCVAIHLALPDFSDASIIALKPRSLAILCQAGYAVDAIRLSKRLPS
ncbi:MAG: hypothetical protein R3F54_23965 [Alphaproteobacteria bacterium]